MKRKFICIIMCLILVLSCTVSANATENNSEDMNVILLEKGYPLEIIQKMSDSAKEVICANPNLIYESGFTLGYIEENGQLVENTLPASVRGIRPLGQIPVNDLELTWTVSLDTSANANERLIIYSYEWKHLPINRWQDPMSVSWNGNYYSMKTGSFYKVDRYDYTILSNGETGSATHSSEPGYASAFENGVTWYADLKGYVSNMTINRLYGHGQFILQKESNPTMTTRLWGHYVHNKAAAALTVSIPYVGGFEVTGGSIFDERGTDRALSF